ncbi:sugar transferase [Litoricolaceae bacterium]|nr:sugar transferase [Litorivicinaceae bacterium]
MTIYRKWGKRLVDVILILVGSPVIVIVVCCSALWVWGGSGVSPFFCSERIGSRGKKFRCWKIRTMRVDTPILSTDKLVSGESYLLRGGRLLRKWSLDELPQAYNILKGDMSLVGYRPALPSQTWINDQREQLGIHVDRPGLTGLAQVNGRDDLSDAQKIEYDTDYASRICLGRDLQIILRTFLVVVKNKGIHY